MVIAVMEHRKCMKWKIQPSFMYVVSKLCSKNYVSIVYVQSVIDNFQKLSHFGELSMPIYSCEQRSALDLKKCCQFLGFFF